MAKSTRPPEIWSSVAHSSATAIGLCMGSTVTAGARRTRLASRAIAASTMPGQDTVPRRLK
jgi:hypothetical protein